MFSIIYCIYIFIYKYVNAEKLIKQKKQTIVNVMGLLMAVGDVNKKLIIKTHMNKQSKEEMEFKNKEFLGMATEIMKNNLEGKK